MLYIYLSGEHDLVMHLAFTFERNATNLDNKKSTFSEKLKISPDNIWTFENYTATDHAEDRERSMRYLKFIWSCLEKGELNISRRKWVASKTSEDGESAEQDPLLASPSSNQGDGSSTSQV